MAYIKICFVCQRYGLEVNGGAEYLCRLYAERMAAFYDVTVLTSCAIDHITWKNEYKEGLEEINGVHVLHFKVAEERDIHQFAAFMNQYVVNQQADCVDDLHWMKSNGPICPELHQYIVDNRDEYTVFIFMGYLYYSTTLCMYAVADKAVLISTAHDELPLNVCRFMNAQFNMPAGFIYLTEEEKELVHAKFNNQRIPYIITGSGVTLPTLSEMEEQEPGLKEKGVLGNYVVYIGRIEEGKSCDLLFRCFEQYKERYGGDLKLILAGKSIMPIPDREDVIWLGFISEEEKFALIKEARVLLLASHQESLSLVVLEALALGVPVLVNANCEVLKGHIDKSNAGLYFYKEADFIAALRYLLTHEAVLQEMSRNGKSYIDQNYSWEIIDKKMIGLIERVSINGQ